MNDIVSRAHQLREIIENLAVSMTDEKALEAVELFEKWNGEGIQYKTGDRVRYNGILYKVLQDHESLSNWTPDTAVSLFARVLIDDPTVIPEWVQPDSTNGYMTGDMVTHNGKTWRSLIDNNVWEPSESLPTLWEEVE